MANDDPLGLFGGGVGGGIMDFLSGVPGLSIVSSLLGLFGGDDGPGSFEDINKIDPRHRFVAPTESLYTANRGMAELGQGLTRRARQPMKLNSPMPGQLSTMGFGQPSEAFDFELPGMEVGGLEQMLSQLLSPKPVMAPVTGNPAKDKSLQLKVTGMQPDGSRTMGVPGQSASLMRKQKKQDWMQKRQGM